MRPFVLGTTDGVAIGRNFLGTTKKSFHYSSQENEYLWHSNKEKLIKEKALRICICIGVQYGQILDKESFFNYVDNTR